MKTAGPEPRTADLGDVTVEYLEYAGKEPAVILLHATGFLPWIWHPIARRLSADNKVLAPYFCDHRIADLDKGGLDWVVLAHDLSRLTRKLRLDATCVVGHSMGGAVAVLACALFGLAPRALVLIEPIFLPEELYRTPLTVEQHPLASKSIRRRRSWEDREAARAYLRSKPLFANWDQEVLDLYLDHGLVHDNQGGLTLACQPEREAALFLGGGHRDPWPLLNDILCPVLVLEGETSENRPFIDLVSAARRFPKGHHVLAKGAGHLIPMEKPDETLKLIRDFQADAA
ncbi:MAG: alpha/beta hydrolase [Thermodesulfobacteriota bacterium]